MSARIYKIRSTKTVGVNGIQFRSATESRFAEWICDRADERRFGPLEGSACFYEYATYPVGRTRELYTPDFELFLQSDRFGTNRRVFMEIKPTRPNGDENALMGNLGFQFGSPGIIFWPDVYEWWKASLFLPPDLTSVSPRMALAKTIEFLSLSQVPITKVNDGRCFGSLHEKPEDA